MVRRPVWLLICAALVAGLCGLTVFTLASLWCGLTASIGMLIAARVVQGLETGTWMLLGSREGSTALDVIVNGELEDSISVRITRSQEGSP